MFLALFFVSSLFSVSARGATSLEGCWELRDRNGESPYWIKFDVVFKSPSVGTIFNISMNRGEGWVDWGENKPDYDHEFDECIWSQETEYPGDSKHRKYFHYLEVTKTSPDECKHGLFSPNAEIRLEILSCRDLTCTERLNLTQNKVACF